MTTKKIFLDTNVIVAASIQAKSEELGKTIAHTHFRESSNLLSALRQYSSNKIGVTSKTVEGEAYRVIIKAIKSEFDKHVNYQNHNAEPLFDEFARICNICLNRTRQLFSFLVIEILDKSEVKKNLEKVNDMVTYVYTLNARYGTIEHRRILAKRKKDASTKFSWTAALHREVYMMFRDQVEREYVQIRKFMEKEPNGNNNDKQILAEAITVKSGLGNEMQFYIASHDTKFFSPLRLKGGSKSELITIEINNRFGITCDTPLEIIKILNS